jgi:hypothetical protein
VICSSSRFVQGSSEERRACNADGGQQVQRQARPRPNGPTSQRLPALRAEDRVNGLSRSP